MSRFEAIFALLALSCGSRTELDANADAKVTAPIRIAFFGSPGFHDESALTTFLSSFGSVTRTQTDETPLTKEVLAAFDVVIIDNLVREYAPQEATVFADWITAGGAAMSLTGYRNTSPDWTRANSLLSPLGVSYVPPPILLTPSPTSISQFATHPLTDGLSSVVFWGGYVIAHGGDAVELAFTGGAPVGVALQRGAGRVFVWGDEWVEYNESFGSQQTKQFWTNAIGWLRP